MSLSMSYGHVGTAREEVQTKNSGPETLLAADQGHQEKQHEPTRSIIKFIKPARATAGEIHL